MVLRELINCGVNCRTFLPSELIQEPGGSILPSTLRRLESLLEIGCIPITFGDIVTSRRGSRIVSGDEIALELARKLGVQRTIFAMDVDGIYSDSSLKGPLVRELVNAREIKASARRYDVTGGIDAKIKIGFELAKLGSDVFFVNGKRESRLQKLLLGDSNTPLTRILSKNIST
jgi:isopentenyl phosphate kinase